MLDDYEYDLVKDLLHDYNALARPSLSHLHPTNVTFDLSLSQLIDVVRKNLNLSLFLNLNCFHSRFVYLFIRMKKISLSLQMPG